MPNGLFGKSVVNSSDPVLVCTTPSNKLRTMNINVLAQASATIGIAITDQQFQASDFAQWFNENSVSSFESFRKGKVTIEAGETVIHPRVYAIPGGSAGGVANVTATNYFVTSNGTTYSRIANSAEYLRASRSGTYAYLTADGQRRSWDQFKTMAAGTAGSSYTNNNWTHIVAAGDSSANANTGAILFKRGANNVQYSSDARGTASTFSWVTAYTVTQGGTIEHIVWMNGTARYYLGMSSALVHYATVYPDQATDWNNSFLTMPAGHASKLRGGVRMASKDVLWFDDNKIATGTDNTATFTYLTLPAEITDAANQLFRIEASDDYSELILYAKDGAIYRTSDLSTWSKQDAVGPTSTGLTVRVAVTVVGGQYYFNGVSQPALRLKRGYRYIFELGDSTCANNEVQFADADNVSYTTGVVVTGTAGSAGARVTFTVPSDAPATLKYRSANSATMTNTITVINDTVTTGVFTKTVNYTVTFANGKFLMNGSEAPTLNLIKGYTYVFDVSSATLANIALSFRNASAQPYTTGVTVNGSAGTSGANVTFVVGSTAPDVLSYLDATLGSATGNSIAVFDNNTIFKLENLDANSKLTQLVDVTASGKIWTREKRFFNIPANSWVEKGATLGNTQVLERTTLMVGPNEQVLVTSSADNTVVRAYGIEE